MNPVYIGSQQNLGLTGPPPLIAPPTPPRTAPRQEAPPGAVGQPTPLPREGTLPQPGIMPEPPPPPPPPPPDDAAAAAAGARADAAQPPPADADRGRGPTAVRLLVTPPGPEMRLGGGPYTVPVSVNNVPRVSTLSVTITYNPTLLRVRSVQEGSFMRQGGVTASFSQQIDPVAGRVDITVVRSQDVVGASGTGLVAALVVEPVAAGSTSFGTAGHGHRAGRRADRGDDDAGGGDGEVGASAGCQACDGASSVRR